MNEPSPSGDVRREQRRRLLRSTGLVVLVFAISAGTVGALRGFRKNTEITSKAPTSTKAPFTRGRVIYEVSCANCHGQDGHGDGPAAKVLNPPPRDFATGEWKYGKSDESIRRIVAQGIPGTAMPASDHTLSAADINAVVAYVQSLVVPVSNAFAPQLRAAGFVPSDDPLPAAELDLRDAKTGRSVVLADFKGQFILLNFWGTECPHCLKEFPQLEHLAQSNASSRWTVIAACADDDDALRVARVADQYAKTLPVFVDPKRLTRTRYEVQLLPTTILIDPSGRVLGQLLGVPDWSGPAMAKLISQCLKGEDQ